jgi:D-glycero-alpha-D-manno-heptose 1-phosphate guanylyltransferase
MSLDTQQRVREAIILAGGLGTRLRPVVRDIPKPMAPICGRPFLAYLLEQLRTYGVERTVLAVGYRHEVVDEYFSSRENAMPLAYSVETEPLGTGGGIRNGLELCSGSTVLVLNGDTFFDVDLEEMLACHLRTRADITVALKPMTNFDRYGAVTVEGERIVAFHEKELCARGYINGGVYLIGKALFAGFDLPERFSFETEFLGKFLNRLTVVGFRSDGYFIDIGIPEDYAQAKRECARLRPSSAPTR